MIFLLKMNGKRLRVDLTRIYFLLLSEQPGETKLFVMPRGCELVSVAYTKADLDVPWTLNIGTYEPEDSRETTDASDSRAPAPCGRLPGA